MTTRHPCPAHSALAPGRVQRPCCRAIPCPGTWRVIHKSRCERIRKRPRMLHSRAFACLGDRVTDLLVRTSVEEGDAHVCFLRAHTRCRAVGAGQSVECGGVEQGHEVDWVKVQTCCRGREHYPCLFSDASTLCNYVLDYLSGGRSRSSETESKSRRGSRREPLRGMVDPSDATISKFRTRRADAARGEQSTCNSSGALLAGAARDPCPRGHWTRSRGLQPCGFVGHVSLRLQRFHRFERMGAVASSPRSRMRRIGRGIARPASVPRAVSPLCR